MLSTVERRSARRAAACGQQCPNVSYATRAPRAARGSAPPSSHVRSCVRLKRSDPPVLSRAVSAESLAWVALASTGAWWA